MYCKSCGKPLNENQSICTECGVLVGDGNSFCAHCGKEVNPNAKFCMGCGVATEASKKSAKKSSSDDLLSGTIGGHNKLTVALICFFFGGWGIHNFMMGETKKGIARLLLSFVGIGSILALIDFIKILTGSYTVDPESYFF